MGLCALFSACGGSEKATEDTQSLADSSQEAAADVIRLSTDGMEIPETLENFDRTFTGNISGKSVQFNLRRYGSELNGHYTDRSDASQVTLKGEIQADGEYFRLDAFNSQGEGIGELNGYIRDSNIVTGKITFTDSDTEDSFELNEIEEFPSHKIQIQDLEVKKESYTGNRALSITYPQLIGIQDNAIAQKVNQDIELYFESETMLDSVETVSYDFKENVTFDVTFFGKDFVSICKHHHLSKNNDTQLFDDSHGININYQIAKVYEVQDLFKPNSLDQLNQIIKARINKSCGGVLSSDELEACILKSNETTSFSLSKDKITFHLTERLPYRYRGCGYVRISYKDLAGLFNPSGPLREILKRKVPAQQET